MGRHEQALEGGEARRVRSKAEVFQSWRVAPSPPCASTADKQPYSRRPIAVGGLYPPRQSRAGNCGRAYRQGRWLACLFVTILRWHSHPFVLAKE